MATKDRKQRMHTLVAFVKNCSLTGIIWRDTWTVFILRLRHLLAMSAQNSFHFATIFGGTRKVVIRDQRSCFVKFARSPLRGRAICSGTLQLCIQRQPKCSVICARSSTLQRPQCSTTWEVTAQKNSLAMFVPTKMCPNSYSTCTSSHTKKSNARFVKSKSAHHRWGFTSKATNMFKSATSATRCLKTGIS